MNKKKVVTVLLTGSLVLGLNSGVLAKGPTKAPAAGSNPVIQEDGRNTNGIETAQITTFGSISGYFGTSQVVSGEVVIDGARDDLANLYITVGGQKADLVWAIPGQPKTYGFTATVDLDSHALTNIEVKTETKFHNGQKAGLTHSNNSSTVDVDVWAVITEYSIDLGTEDGAPNFVWNEETATYSLSFKVIKTLSNGETEDEVVTLTGLTPGGTVSYSTDDLSDDNYFGNAYTLLNNTPVPASPTVPVVDVVVSSISNISLTLDPQGPNQFKVVADYTIHYSDGSSVTVSKETLPGGNISNPTTQNQNSETREYNIGGTPHDVTVTYSSSTNTFSASAVKK
ncbi:hypothetical protein [Bacillus sp. FJAT-45350]|uniref:hypothetical protein n=1 Tax=Bacillus sp. FJAT-45350 TaxID=2011014 RepID=UPI000BB7F7C0|nr:hypothetical protein [Bacillus sp. FJAT-45350]